MLDIALVASSFGASVAAGIFLAAGLNMRRRSVSNDAETAVQLFSVWWLGLAIFAVAGASTDLTLALGINPFEVLLSFHYARIIALCIGLWGLMYYIAYVFTGRRTLLVPLAIFYALYYAVIVFFLTAGLPTAIEAEPWPQVELAAPVLDAAAATLLLLIPPIVAAATYLGLYLKTDDVSQRARILLVCVGTLVWFAGTLARDTNLAAAWMPLVMGMLAAWAVAWAYAPPKWLAEKLDASAAAAR